MSTFTILNGSEHIFGTDDPEMLRSFLQHPGTNQPTLSADMRLGIQALHDLLPKDLHIEQTIQGRSTDIHRQLRIVIKNPKP